MVVGVGSIGGAVARAAKRAGLRVLGVNRHGKATPGVDRMVPSTELDNVLPLADYVFMAMPLTEETRGMMDRRRLTLMKRGSGIVNVGREGVTDYAALAELLRSGHLSGAVLDVFDAEPLPAEIPALAHAEPDRDAARLGGRRQFLRGDHAKAVLREHAPSSRRREAAERGQSRPGILSDMVDPRRLKVRVRQITVEAERIRSYELVDPAGAALPSFTAGAHLEVWLPSGLARSYSLANDPTETDRYVIAVQRELAGRGGSAEMHDAVNEGDLIEVSVPRNNFPLAANATHHRLIAGGIGITPILSMVRELERTGQNWSLHYCTRQPDHTAFRELLAAPPFADRVRLHHDGGNPVNGLDFAALLRTPQPGEKVYCCGPTGFMNAVQSAMVHWPAGSLHLEHFTAAPALPASANGAFEIELASSSKVFTVPADRSILELRLERERHRGRIGLLRGRLRYLCGAGARRHARSSRRGVR